MNKTVRFFLIILLLISVKLPKGFSQKINRKNLVERHIVVNTKIDTLASLSVGNGGFAFTVDATGLQTFPEKYAKGVPLGTQSEWGWHSFPNTENYKFEETLTTYQFNGRPVSYSVQSTKDERAKKAISFLRQNPHRLQLGNLGFEILKKDGSKAQIEDIKDIRQTLNPWTGEIKSQFSVEGEKVELQTYSHQQKDLISVKINSKLLQNGQLKIRFRYPFPTDKFTDEGVNYQSPEKHSSRIVSQHDNQATLIHRLDSTKYFTHFSWQNKAQLAENQRHDFLITPQSGSDIFQFSCQFSEKEFIDLLPNFTETALNSEQNWRVFWSRGGAIDFTGSTDPRAKELERRIILSQYLTKIQCAGSQPPQETGLTYNSWFGKPHLEMHWWHGVHFALWNRIDLLEKSMNWYAKVADKAKKIAQRQGYEGVRWQKMTDAEGNETASSVGAFLIWQQPHFIYFAELMYRDKPNEKTLKKYQDLVFATADFMASYAYFDKEKGRYILGKGLIPAQERFRPEETFNPTYELAYWHWALTTAQQWHLRLHQSRNPKYDEVLSKLSPLPQAEGVYLAAESAKDSYTNPVFLTDHPSVLGTLGMLPESVMLDKKIMRNTFDKIWKIWNWKDTWGWDFPMVAMTATRLNMPEKAIDTLLMPIKTNTYLPNGHNYQDERLRLYLPGNGGLLAAIAMMCTNEKGSGIPKNGWKVSWEGLKKMP